MSPAHALLEQLRAAGVTVRRLRNDSRQVRPGDVFLAYPGETTDGRQYIDHALAAGAAAVVAEKVSRCDTAMPALNVPYFEVAGLSALCGEMASELHGDPSRKLWIAGITGTNGKTSVSQWLAQALTMLGERTAVIGTLGNGFYGELVASPNTTPDALVLQAALADFVAQGATCCAMEVSSIGVEEQRINGVAFDLAVFTNLTRDHLDYHGSMETYAAAKAKLFAWPDLKAVVINLDDPFGHDLLAALPAGVRVIPYTLDPTRRIARTDVETLCPQDLDLSGKGMMFMLDGVRFSAPLVGRFNASNLLAVIAALQWRGHTLEAIAAAVTSLKPPPGRMETLGGEGVPLVVVDYAHTPDALEKVLQVLRETAQARGGRLHCVFGCGGDRDAGKRPRMGAIAQALADVAVVTSDNPRSEDPQQIIREVLAGMQPGARTQSERKLAISETVHAAGAHDVVLIAGKGHEPYQEIAGVRHPFSDLAVAKSALEGWQS